MGERTQGNRDECEENFVVRIHQAAHLHIDDMADKYERMGSLLKITKDKSIEFLSRISK